MLVDTILSANTIVSTLAIMTLADIAMDCVWRPKSCLWRRLVGVYWAGRDGVLYCAGEDGYVWLGRCRFVCNFLALTADEKEEDCRENDDSNQCRDRDASYGATAEW